MRIISLMILFIVLCVFANAQPGTNLITGTVTESANVELTIYKTLNKKTETLAEYKVYPGSPDFAFVIPTEKDASYKMAIRLMKQGHRRLELEKGYTILLPVKTNQNLSIKITPSTLDEAKQKGVEIKNNSQSTDVSFVSGNLVNWKFGGEIGIQRVVDGELVSVASFSTPNTNKRFLFAIPVKQEGFYYVTSMRFRLRVYLKPADHLELNVNAFAGEYEVINGSEENRLMDKWQKLFLPATQYGYNISVFQSDTINL